MLTLVLAPLCCGCLEATSLDEYGYVLTIGVDQGEQKNTTSHSFCKRKGTHRKHKQEQVLTSLLPKETIFLMRSWPRMWGYHMN